VDAVLKPLFDPKQGDLHATCEKFIGDLYHKLPVGPDRLVNSRLEDWVKFLRERGREADADRVQALIVDVP
jgi:hypothetical protein